MRTPADRQIKVSFPFGCWGKMNAPFGDILVPHHLRLANAPEKQTFYVHFISMQVVVKNATNEVSKSNINLSSASRYSFLSATNGIHTLKKSGNCSSLGRKIPAFGKRKRLEITKIWKCFTKSRRAKECVRSIVSPFSAVITYTIAFSEKIRHVSCFTF